MNKPELSFEEIQAVLENASIGIAFTRDRVFRLCNQRSAEIFGFASPADMIGKGASIIYPDAESYVRIGAEAGPLLAAGRAFQADWLFRRTDGSPVWCHVYAKGVDPRDSDRGTVWIVEDITERRRVEETLHKTMRKLAALMQNAPLGIGSTRDRMIVDYNPRWAEMFGYEGNEAVGLPARVCFRSDEEYEAIGRQAAPLLLQGKPFQTELFMRRKDGSDFWTSFIGYVQNQQNTQEGTIWIFEDRTAAREAQELLRRTNEELAAARDRAEIANRAKNEFLANMSHELRTPLNAVLGYAQILERDRGLSQRQRVSVETIDYSGRHLLTLINDILDLARIEAGKLDLVPSRIDLGAFLRVVCDIIRVKAEARDLVFSFDAAPNLPRFISIDEKRLRQVLLNLLGNAVKFTDQGGITLRVRAGAGGGEQTPMHFEVEDTGIGIAAEHHAVLFRPFEQVGDSAHRAGGAGLGLSISRALVRLMGGDIGFTSTPGEGSRFWFDLSVSAIGEVAPPPSDKQVVGYRGARKKVLVVDDVAESRAMLADFFGLIGFTVYEAADGVQAVEQAQALVPDLIVMDNVMPRMSGMEATRRIRATPPLRTLPIIAISASASTAHEEQSRAVGADAFLPKPVDLTQLLDQMGALLGLSWIFEEDADAPPR